MKELWNFIRVKHAELLTSAYFAGCFGLASAVFAPGFSTIFRLICTISSVIVLPRTVLRCLSPFLFGEKPAPPLSTTFRRTPPCTFPLMGTPSLSEPPRICTLCAGMSTAEPSIFSPILLPMSGAARASSSSTTFDVPALGSDTITLNFASC